MYQEDGETKPLPACHIHHCHEFMEEEIDLFGRYALCAVCKLTLTRSEEVTELMQYTGPEETVDNFYCGCEG